MDSVDYEDWFAGRQVSFRGESVRLPFWENERVLGQGVISTTSGLFMKGGHEANAAGKLMKLGEAWQHTHTQQRSLMTFFFFHTCTERVSKTLYIKS
jgi:hypothetical protein